MEDEKVENKIETEHEVMPEWMKYTEDGNLAVKTKEGVYILEDVPYKKVMAAQKRITRPDGQVDQAKFELALISESLVKPKVGELDLQELRTSTMLRLKAAIYKLYDMASFLSM